MTGPDLSQVDGVAPPSDEVLDTGDLVIDAALRDLMALDGDDLDGHIEAAESLQRTLQARLANLGE